MGTSQAPTKRDQILKLISRRAGADIRALCASTGWAPHSIRAAICGLRKAGYTVARGAPNTKEKGAVYRLIARPAEA